MRHFAECVRIAAIAVSAVTTLAGQAHALLITPTFDGSLTGNANALAYEAAVNTAIGTIDGLYKSPGTVGVLFKFDSSVHGSSLTSEYNYSYSAYKQLLSSDLAAHPGNSILAIAVANLSHGNIANTVNATSALTRVPLGQSGNVGCLNSAGLCGTGGSFDSIVSIGNLSTNPAGAGFNSQAVSVLEHELNEVLGGGGTGTTLGDNLTSTIGPTDFYRYHSATSTCAGITSTPSYTTSTAEVACYSIDGGATSLVQLNQTGGGADYGDFASGVANIQDAFDPGTTPVYSIASPEYKMMLSIGWNVSEPTTVALLAGATAGLGWMRRRRPATNARPA
jgi:hypothetical protein